MITQQTRHSLLWTELPLLLILKLIGTNKEQLLESRIKDSVDHAGLFQVLVPLKESIRSHIETCLSSLSSNLLIAHCCKEVILDVEVDGHMLP